MTTTMRISSRPGLASDIVFPGKMLEVRSDRVRLPDGSEGDARVRRAPGRRARGAGAGRRRLVLERQFRFPVRRVMLEFPAGKIDAGETSLATAQRELVEEVGYTAATWKPLGTIHPEVGYSTEFIDLFEATGLTHVGRPPRRRRIHRSRHDDRGRVARAVRLRRRDRRQDHRGIVRVAAEAMKRRSRARLVIHGRVQGVAIATRPCNPRSSTRWQGGCATAATARWKPSCRARRKRSSASRVGRRGPPLARVTAVECRRRARWVAPRVPWRATASRRGRLKGEHRSAQRAGTPMGCLAPAVMSLRVAPVCAGECARSRHCPCSP